MDEEESQASSSKIAKIETDFNACIICQNSSTGDTSKPKKETLQKLFGFISEYASYGDLNISPVYHRLKSTQIDVLLENNSFYHRHCHSNIVNERNLKRTKDRFLKAKSQRSANFVIPKRGRPSSTQLPATVTTENSPNQTLRSSTPAYDSRYCIICQKPGGTLHKVMTKPKGERLYDIGQKIADKSLMIRLNTLSDPTDAVANDVQYHQNCWVYIQRSVPTLNKNNSSENIDNMYRIAADIEILNAIRYELSMPTGTSLNMNNINTTYINLLKDTVTTKTSRLTINAI